MKKLITNPKLSIPSNKGYLAGYLISYFALINMGNNSNTCQDPDKVIFHFLSYKLTDHEKKLLDIPNFWSSLKCCLDILIA